MDLAVHTVRLADSAGLVRLLSMVNSLQQPLCQMVTRRWEALRTALSADACIYTVSMDPPEMQARWQDQTGVLHQALSRPVRSGLRRLAQGVAPLAAVGRGD